MFCHNGVESKRMFLIIRLSLPKYYVTPVSIIKRRRGIIKRQGASTGLLFLEQLKYVNVLCRNHVHKPYKRPLPPPRGHKGKAGAEPIAPVARKCER